MADPLHRLGCEFINGMEEACMPGPMSDSYDPEFGTGENAHRVRGALQDAYVKVSSILNNMPPMHILDLVDAHLPKEIDAYLTEKDWRLIRFALERAQESI